MIDTHTEDYHKNEILRIWLRVLLNRSEDEQTWELEFGMRQIAAIEIAKVLEYNESGSIQYEETEEIVEHISNLIGFYEEYTQAIKRSIDCYPLEAFDPRFDAYIALTDSIISLQKSYFMNGGK